MEHNFVYQDKKYSEYKNNNCNKFQFNNQIRKQSNKQQCQYLKTNQPNSMLQENQQFNKQTVESTSKPTVQQANS